MSSFVKSNLKTAREYIGKKDFTKARDAVEEVLSYEPDNYNANVFLGLALFELGLHDESEQAYLRAIKAQPDQILGYQGLVKFYEQTKQWNKLAEALRTLLDLFAKSGDATKCAEQLQKYIELRREHGSRKEIIEALHLLLPTSPYFSTLSSLPEPDPTAPLATTTFVTQTATYNSLPILQEIVSLTEAEEETILSREVEKRRMRLDSANAGPEALKKQIGLGIWSTSKLPDLYREVINHPNTSDELRRETEAKLLRYRYKYLCALGSNGTEKNVQTKLRAEVQGMIDGVVLLEIPDEFAWSLYIEGKNVDNVVDYGLDVLRKYEELFPTSLSSVAIRGYFLYYSIPQREEKEDVEDEAEAMATPIEEMADNDPFDLVLEAVAGLPESILAHRMLCDIYLDEKDYPNAIATSERGLQLARKRETDTGSELSQVRKAFNVSLATGLVHLFPPKHHSRAIRILDEVLSVDPNNPTCLMGRGYVLEAARKWNDAAGMFLKVANQLPDDVEVGLTAKEEYAWCLAEKEEPGLESAIAQLQAVLDQIEPLEGYHERKARLWWRVGQCYWRLDTSSLEDAYRHFITSLKRSSSFAPAFTSLGIYYAEVSPPDPIRAAKCFQKAFELDAREVEAAQRLAHTFAEEREWDLVEVVARRTIEGEGGLGGGLGDNEASIIAEHKPTNAWAFKALGVVELNRRHFPEAIRAFQVALRSNENDGLSWLRLGEAYMSAGRHAAALKALNKARDLRPDDWMCVYLLGDVQRQTGLLTQAIATFNAVLEKVPHETTVLLSLAQTHLAQGHSESSTGYLARASVSFLFAVSSSLDLVDSSPGFRRLALKTTADALIALADFSNFADAELARHVLTRAAALHTGKIDEKLSGAIDLPLIPDTAILDGNVALRLAVVTYNYRLTLFAKDDEGIGSAWYDLGVNVAQIAHSRSSQVAKEKASKQGVEFVRLALLSDPGNAVFWNAFGNLNFTSRPMISQHAYIKALEINSKDASVWTNLGLLYLHNEDLVLANEAFLKAQTLDPDYTLAWVGQGLVAIANNHVDDAHALFEHAIGLSSNLPAADIRYAYDSFRKLPVQASRSHGSTQDDLLLSFFSLDRYCRRKSNDSFGLHLFGLVCERLHLDDLGTEVMTRAIKQLEATYEETEDPVIERRYAVANTNLGRMLLAKDDLEQAIDAFEIAFGLLPTDQTESDTDVVVLRSMCRLGRGIAEFRLGNLNDALAMFDSAQEIASAKPLVRGQVTVLLAKTLWATGTEECRDMAKEQLFDCIQNDPDNLAAVIALAAMGLLIDDETLIDAALSEILALPLDERHKRDPERDVERLLTNHYLAEENVAKASSVVQAAVHAEPHHLESRKDLASLSISQGRPEVARALLSRLLDSSQLYSVSGSHASLRLLAIATVASGSGSMTGSEAWKMAQKTIKLAPWDEKNWLALAYVRAASNK